MFGNYLLGEYEDVHLYSGRDVQDSQLWCFCCCFLRKTAEYEVSSRYFTIQNYCQYYKTRSFFIDFILLKLHKNYVNIYLFSGLETIQYIDSLF